MTDQPNNIIFWISFVGVAIFIVQSIQAVIVLRHSKNKDFRPPDLMMTSITVTMAIMFVALAISNNLKLQTKPPAPTQSNTFIELHRPAGRIYEWNNTTKKIDTIEIFRKK